MIRSTWSAHIFLFIATCFSSINYSVAKIVMPSELHSNSIVLTRIAIATIFFFIFDYFQQNEKVDVPTKDKYRIIACGLFGVALNQLFLYKGLSITSPINSSLIMAIIPILIMLFSVLFLKLKPTWIQYTGITLSAMGAYYLIFFTHQSSSISSLEGDLYILLNASCYAIFMVIAKPLLEKYDAIFITKWSFATAFIIVLPFTLSDTTHENWIAISNQGWMAYIYVILFATLFNYYVANATLKWMSSVAAGSYIYLQPFMATLFAVATQHDELSSDKLMAGVVIILGLLMTSKFISHDR
jgi:drug/metabolite transporter (DMT)-like permease